MTPGMQAVRRGAGERSRGPLTGRMIGSLPPTAPSAPVPARHQKCRRPQAGRGPFGRGIVSNSPASRRGRGRRRGCCYSGGGAPDAARAGLSSTLTSSLGSRERSSRAKATVEVFLRQALCRHLRSPGRAAHRRGDETGDDVARGRTRGCDARTLARGPLGTSAWAADADGSRAFVPARQPGGVAPAAARRLPAPAVAPGARSAAAPRLVRGRVPATWRASQAQAADVDAEAEQRALRPGRRRLAHRV